MRAYLRDLWDGVRIIASREFWRAFRDHWSPDATLCRWHIHDLQPWHEHGDNCPTIEMGYPCPVVYRCGRCGWAGRR